MEQLPAVNATLNAISFVLLMLAFRQIKRKNIAAHRKLMITAFICSIVFLGCYLLHKWYLFETTGSINKKFAGPDGWRIAYLILLFSHVVLAATVPVLASITLFRGLKMNVVKHRRIARITFPIWTYVSVTGVIVYFMLYQWFKAS